MFWFTVKEQYANMLKEWYNQYFGGKKPEEEVKPVANRAYDPEAQPLAEQKPTGTSKPRRDGGKGGPHPNNSVAYDNIFRRATQVLLDGQMNQLTEGLQINVARQAQTIMLSSKWQLASPQTSAWEFGLHANGFVDMVAVTYSTTQRWTMMYQRVTRAGALVLMQFMTQPQQMGMGPAGQFFGLLQYPWIKGGCTQLQYVGSAQVALSHMQKTLHGVYLGSQLSYDIMTRGTSLSYGLMVEKPNTVFGAEFKPDSGEWKVAYTKSDWESDADVTAQLELSDKRHGKMNLLSVGYRKYLIGGGVLHTAISGFSKLKASLDLPFGCDREGINQVRFHYNLVYEIRTGGLKQGVSVTL